MSSYLTPDEVKNDLRISAATLWRWVRDMNIPVVKFGRLVRFPVKEYEKWKREREQATAKELRV